MTVLFALALIGPIVTLIRPTLVEFRVATRALFDAAFAVLGSISLAIGQWVVIAPNVKATEELVGLVDAVNLGVRIGVAVDDRVHRGVVRAGVAAPPPAATRPRQCTCIVAPWVFDGRERPFAATALG